MSAVTCKSFEDAVEELAVDVVPEPERSALLSHAATCDRCQSRLRELVSLADQLLLLAPSADPPAGFDVRAAARMGGATPARRATHRRLIAAAAAALVLVLVGAAVLAGRATVDRHPSEVAAVRSASVVRTGDRVGDVRLVGGATPVVVLTVANPQPFDGVRHCYLIFPDGREMWVGEWSYDEIESGVWAAPLAPGALDAARMEIRDDHDAVLASAVF